MKIKLYLVLIVTAMLLSVCTVSYSQGKIPSNVYGNIDSNWVTYEKTSSAYWSQVVTNAQNIVAQTITGEYGIVFVTRDIVKSKRAWEINYSDSRNSSKREVAFWRNFWEMCGRSVNLTVQFVIVYKDKYNHRYRTYCYKAQCYDVNDNLVATKSDDAQSMLSGYGQYLEEMPKLQRAINKYLEVNRYSSLDALFKAKGIE